MDGLLSGRVDLLTTTAILSACQESNVIVEDNPFEDDRRTTEVVSNGSDEQDDALVSMSTSPARVLTNVEELGEEKTALQPTPSVCSSGNRTKISGKNSLRLNNLLLCPATPGRPEDDQAHPPEMTPPHEVGDDQTPGPSTSDERCEEDLLPTPTTPRTEEEGQNKNIKKDVLNVSNCVYVGGGNCVDHGPGAKRYWRPRPRTVGPDGVLSPLEKEYYYQCKVGDRGRGRFRQARLSSFFKTTPKKN